MRPTSGSRLGAVIVAVMAALILQVTVLPNFAWEVGGRGVVPGLVMLVVVATALATDTRYGMLTGFVAGLLLDVAPPADHAAGRWALALLVVGYVVGRLAHDNTVDVGRDERTRRPALILQLSAAAGGSFLASTVFAFTGLVLGELGASVGELLAVTGVALVLDLVAALAVIPFVWWLLGRGAAQAGRLGTGRPGVGSSGSWARG